MLYGGIVLALIIFTAMSDGRTSLVRSVTLRTKAGRARRENGVLEIDDGRNILKNSFDNTPVFYERNEQGVGVPVKIRFYTFGRWLSILFNALVTVFLPAIIAAVIRLATMGKAPFMEGFKPVYGAAWYVIAAFIVLLYLIKGVRKDVYDHPYLYELLPNGGRRLMWRRADRKVTVLSMFGVGQIGPDGKRVTLLGFFRMLGRAGTFLGVALLLILLGSASAIVM